NAAFAHKLNPSRLSVSVASMAIKRNPDKDRINGVSKFDAKPWSIEEFYAAANDDDFFEQVEPFLLQTGEEPLGKDCAAKLREELISRKCYYSGNSARWTWGTSIPDVISDIDDFVKQVPNSVDVLKGVVGEASADSVNHLTCRYTKGTFFASKYIAKKVLLRGGAEVVRMAYGIASGLNNPSFTGWVVEMDFINQ
ncbi:hypothetical protein MP638_007401, partial [Amoeboaphelidium occidentale]